MKDSFLTCRYKNGHINSYYDREAHRTVYTVRLHSGSILPANSMRHAKLLITRNPCHLANS